MPPPLRLLANAISRPSGDHAGVASIVAKSTCADGRGPPHPVARRIRARAPVHAVRCIVGRLSKQEALAELVVRLEHELVPAGEVRAALDLGDDALARLLDDLGGELAADDAAVA
jgi:hypothetical protein